MGSFGFGTPSAEKTGRREILGYLNLKPEEWRTAESIADGIGDIGSQAEPAIAALVADGHLLVHAPKSEGDSAEYRISSRGVQAVERPFGFREFLPLATPIISILIVFILSLISLSIAKQQMNIAATAYGEEHQPQLALTCTVELKYSALASALVVQSDPSAENLAKMVEARHVPSPFVTNTATDRLRCILANRGRGVAQNVRLTFAAHYTRDLGTPDIACENVPVPPLPLTQTLGHPNLPNGMSAPFDVPARQSIAFLLYNRAPAWLRYEAPSYAVAMRDGQAVQVGLSTEGGGNLAPAPTRPPPPAFNMHAWLVKIKAEKSAPVNDCPS